MLPESSKRPDARLDKLAERVVEDLCFELGGTCHRVEDDQHGWDLMVEFPARKVDGSPDQQPAIRRCLIQVKSTRSGQPRTAVKLSNGVKFAKDTLPCFVALVSYPARGAKPDAIYLRHFWTPLIAQALSAARQAGLRHQQLNRLRMPIKFEKSDRKDELTAEAVIAAIDEIGARYGEQKRKISEGVGYEAGGGEATFELGANLGMPDFKDLLLGLKDSIAIENLRFVDKRFGFAAPPVFKGAGLLSLVHERPKCVVSLEHRRSGEELSWPGRIYSDYLAGENPKHGRVRAAAGPMQVLIRSAGTTTVTWKQAMDEPLTLEDLRRSAEARSWLSTDEEVDVSVWSEGRRVTVDRLDFEKRKELETWRELATAVRALCAIAPPERRPAELLISLDDVFKRLASLTQFASWLGPEPCTIRAVGELDWREEMESATHLILPWMLRMGDFVFVAIFERKVLEARRQGGQADYQTAEGRLLRGVIAHAKDDAHAIARAEIDWARRRAVEPGKALLSYEPDSDDSGTIVLTTDSGDLVALDIAEAPKQDVGADD